MRALYAFDRVGTGVLKRGSGERDAESDRVKGEGEQGQQGWRGGRYFSVAA